MEIKRIDKIKAEMFVKKYHYSKIMPRITKHYLGFYENEKLIGVMTLGWGTQPLQTIKKLFPNENLETKDYIEIGRMCFLPNYNSDKNTGSKVISVLEKWLKKNTNHKFLYTLADGIMGKVGYVYQASNFKYIGHFMTSVYMDKETKEKIHPRSAKKLREENANYEGKKKVFWLTHDFCEYKGIDKINGKMFRYIKGLNKKARKVVEKTFDNLDYPKDKDLVFKKRIGKGRFVDVEMPQFNMNIFNHNYQKNHEGQLNLFEVQFESE